MSQRKDDEQEALEAIEAALDGLPEENSPAVRVATLEPRSWWETPVGREVSTYFDAWGAVVRVRIETGDPSALPCLAMGSAGGRGSASDAPDVLYRFAAVEPFVSRGCTTRQVELLTALHVRDGFEERVIAVRYLLVQPFRGSKPNADDWTDWLSPKAQEPVRHYGRQERSRRTQILDLARFPAPEVDELCKFWGWSKRVFLEREHLRLGRELALELRL